MKVSWYLIERIIMQKEQFRLKYIRKYIILIIFCTILNLIGDYSGKVLPYNINLNVIGVMLSGLIGGYLPSIIVVILTSITKTIPGLKGAYYGIFALLYTFGAAKLRKMYIKRNYTTPIEVFLASYLFIFIIAIINSFIMYSLRFTLDYDYNIFANYFLSKFDMVQKWGCIFGNIVFLTFEKLICMYVTIGFLILIPDKLKRDFYYINIWQDYLPDKVEKYVKVKNKYSISNKLFFIVHWAIFTISLLSFMITFSMFRRTIIQENTKTAQTVVNFMYNTIDADKIIDIKEKGADSIYYKETETLLTTGLSSNEDIKFVYMYDINRSGMISVVDIYVPGYPTYSMGDRIEMSKEIVKKLPEFLSGKEVGPVITNDAVYGYLLSYFKPIKSEEGDIICYLCCDISMDKLIHLWTEFILKFVYFISAIIICEIIIAEWFIDKSILRPIKALSVITRFFAKDMGDNKRENLQILKDMNIRTNDEIEDLYHSVVNTFQESTEYIEQIQKHNEVMTSMQHNLIVMLAELVESRDNDTGQHIKKTAEYVNIIGRKMKEEGYYADVIDDEFVEHITEAAPLHDIGKIQVSDLILRKPGKLTDKEFEEMKKHTIYGGQILNNAIRLMPEMKYLKEAQFMAEFHHEKWNGEGYPHAIRGEIIPISARIMAVADVFDALVSERCYKRSFTFEEALDIIKKEKGQQFDPLVVDAFFKAIDEIKTIKEKYEEQQKEVVV